MTDSCRTLFTSTNIDGHHNTGGSPVLATFSIRPVSKQKSSRLNEQIDAAVSIFDGFSSKRFRTSSNWDSFSAEQNPKNTGPIFPGLFFLLPLWHAFQAGGRVQE
jgi:hypothetical protein